MKNNKRSTAANPAGLSFSQAAVNIEQTLNQTPGLTSFTRAQRLAAPKMRTGGGPLIIQLAQAAAANPDLVPARIDPNLMQQRLTDAASLQAVQDALATGLQSAEDTKVSLTGASWNDGLAVYAALERVTDANPQIREAVAAMTAFLAKRSKVAAPPKKKKGKGATTDPAPTAPSAPTTGAAGGGTAAAGSGTEGGTQGSVPVYTPTPKS